MSTKEAAQYLGLSPYYLRNLRHLLHAFDGPKYSMAKRPGNKRGGLMCVYLKEDLDAWAREHKGRKPLNSNK